jgi:hypothetical protein
MRVRVGFSGALVASLLGGTHYLYNNNLFGTTSFLLRRSIDLILYHNLAPLPSRRLWSFSKVSEPHGIGRPRYGYSRCASVLRLRCSHRMTDGCFAARGTKELYTSETMPTVR